MKKKIRNCLKCLKTFGSIGPENRLCEPCKNDEIFSRMADKTIPIPRKSEHVRADR